MNDDTYEGATVTFHLKKRDGTAFSVHWQTVWMSPDDLWRAGELMATIRKGDQLVGVELTLREKVL
ncbi:hypothetical protein [Lacticaseibacillus hegangensis]|uniref:Uncharacterized protein n=1 Tax=Lacticaseibacillus hegangensis TaxID=2486010 RepID=A0ABW4CWA7_9LACO|nr:hypothetical protein [Lacticaseibacillus hegangensis]